MTSVKGKNASLSFLNPSIKSSILAVDRIVLQSFHRSDPSLVPILKYSYTGGKRLRPIIIILIAHLFRKGVSRFIKLAAAVELLHTASLIHDDIIDNAEYRRGKPALHNARSVNCAVLTGDYLFAQSVDMIARLGDPELISVLSSILRTMSAGELKCSLSQNPITTRGDYYRYISAKTASLCSGAARMSAMLAHAKKHQLNALEQYGREIGLAFQIVDDVLDIVGQVSDTGKAVGRDLYTGLYTLPTIYYLKKHKEENIINPLLIPDPDRTAIHDILASIKESGVLQKAMDEAAEHVKKARELLLTFPDCRVLSQMSDLADYVLKRNE